MQITPLPDQIYTKFQRLQPLQLSVGVPAIHWNLWEDCVTEPDVEKFKMAASKLQIQYLRFQTRYQRNSNGYTYIFGVQLSIGTHKNTMRPNRKWTNPRWWPPNFKCMYLRSQTRYQRNSNGYTYVFWIQLSIGTHENTMRPNRKWKISRWRPLNFKYIYLRF